MIRLTDERMAQMGRGFVDRVTVTTINGRSVPQHMEHLARTLATTASRDLYTLPGGCEEASLPSGTFVARAFRTANDRVVVGYGFGFLGFGALSTLCAVAGADTAAFLTWGATMAAQSQLITGLICRERLAASKPLTHLPWGVHTLAGRALAPFQMPESPTATSPSTVPQLAPMLGS